MAWWKSKYGSLEDDQDVFSQNKMAELQDAPIQPGPAPQSVESINISRPPSATAQAAQSAGATAAIGAAGGMSPGMMAAGVGGQFLVSYLANKAAEFENKKKMEMEAQSQYAQSQNQALGNLMNAYRSALL